MYLVFASNYLFGITPILGNMTGRFPALPLFAERSGQTRVKLNDLHSLIFILHVNSSTTILCPYMCANIGYR